MARHNCGWMSNVFVLVSKNRNLKVRLGHVKTDIGKTATQT